VYGEGLVRALLRSGFVSGAGSASPGRVALMLLVSVSVSPTPCMLLVVAF
jgi:hypothetical protein